MNKSSAIFLAIAFPLIYVAISPWRHPYYNKPLCVFLVVVLTMITMWGMRNRIKAWTGIVAVTLASYVISIASFLLAWAVESADGLSRTLTTSEPSIVIGTVFGLPLFSYSIPVVLLVLTINKYLRAPHQVNQT